MVKCPITSPSPKPVPPFLGIPPASRGGSTWAWLLTFLALLLTATAFINPALLAGFSLSPTSAVSAMSPGTSPASGALASMLASAAPIVVLACGLACVVLVGEIDISVGSIFGLCATVMGLTSSLSGPAWPAWAAMLAAAAAGALIGTLNGCLVVLWRAPSIVVTLAMMSVLRGTNELLLAGTWITDMRPDVRDWGTARWLGLAPSVWFAAVFAAVLALLLGRSAWGLRLYAAGGSSLGAHAARVRVPLIKITAFLICGSTAGLAAALSTSRLAVIESGLGVGLEVLAVTAVVLAGVSVTGGRGLIASVAIAAILISACVRTVLVYLKLGDSAVFWEQAVHGSCILAAVWADHARRRHAHPPPSTPDSLAHSAAPPPSRFLSRWAVLSAISALALATIALTGDPFASWSVQAQLAGQSAETLIVAAGMFLVVLAGGIDLSVGSIMGLAAVVAGLCHQSDAPWFVTAAAAILTGLSCGLFNALAVGLLRLEPLVVTLATLAAFRGIAEGLSSARTVSGFPSDLASLANPDFSRLGLPAVVFIALLVVLAVWGWSQITPAGRSAVATGNSESAALRCGIRTAFTKSITYAASGACAGVAAVSFIARRNTAGADVGAGIELDAVTAVVLAGASLSGGRGSMPAVLAAVVLIHLVRQYISWRFSADEAVVMVIGALLLASLLAQHLAARPRTRTRKPPSTHP